MDRFTLYKQLRDAGFPQGGIGTYIMSPDGLDAAYVPHSSEIINHFIADPKGWENVRDILAQEWLNQHVKKA